MGMVSPSLFILAWMAVISCIVRPADAMGSAEAASMVASVVASLFAMLSEAGALESGHQGEKKRVDMVLQLVALVAFMGRLVAFCLGAA